MKELVGIIDNAGKQLVGCIDNQDKKLVGVLQHCGQQGPIGPQGLPGLQGKSILNAFVNDDGYLIIEIED